jgi:hypothetical protein
MLKHRLARPDAISLAHALEEKFVEFLTPERRTFNVKHRAARLLGQVNTTTAFHLVGRLKPLQSLPTQADFAMVAATSVARPEKLRL